MSKVNPIFDLFGQHVVGFHSKKYEYPLASGTLITFKAKTKQKYAILCATHTAEALSLLQEKYTAAKIIIARIPQADGYVKEITIPGVGLATILDKKHSRHLKNKHPGIYNNSEQDISLILIHEEYIDETILKKSYFYDINKQKSILKEIIQQIQSKTISKDIPFFFYKAACNDDEITKPENITILNNTAIFHGKLEDIKVKLHPA